MTNADPGLLGRTLAKLRTNRGYTQQQVAGRISTYYSEAGTYGRIERGERYPEREKVVAILIHGLMIHELAEINRILQLAEYEALSVEETQSLGLAQAVAGPPEEPQPVVPPHNPSRDWRLVGVLLASVALTGWIALLIPEHASFVLVTSFFYAGLFVVSLYLESAFNPESPPSRRALYTFGFISVSSAAALGVDNSLADSSNEAALPLSLAIFVFASIAQFGIVRRALSDSPIVTATFQTRTAQGAHLKNTSYFLLIVLLFWLPPFHAVATLSREVRLGHADWVRQMLAQDLMLGKGLIALSVRWLLGLLLTTLIIAWYMGAHLLDNLRPHRQLNSFTLLFYLRALLYFLLCLLCIGWYAYSLDGFL